MRNDVLNISKQTLSRLPYFLEELKKQKEQEKLYVSASCIAAALGLNEVQVRKDLASVSSAPGKPKFGFETNLLIRDIEEVLGYNNKNEAAIVGVGSLGRAFISYGGFADYGVKIVVGFDLDNTLVGSEIRGTKVLHISKLEDMIKRLNIKMAIITAPASQAQGICDSLVKAGVQAIWNFAPVKLIASDNVLVQNENMAASLAALTAFLK